MVRDLGIIKGPGIIYLDSPKDQGDIQGPGNNQGNTILIVMCQFIHVTS